MTKKILYFLYMSTLGNIIRPVLNRGLVNKVAGFYCDLTFSRVHVKKFIRKNKINMNDFIVPKKGYKTFNDFFIRRLAPGARPISSADVVSPADGYIFSIKNISKTDTFFVKSQSFNLEKFLNNKDLAKEHENGTMLIFRLTPSDYHRYRFPINCKPGHTRRVAGHYDSVDPTVYKSGKQPLLSNERRVTALNEDSLMISVGALSVGKIVETHKPNVLYQKGDEAGYFKFGGSTVILLFKPDKITVNEKFLQYKEVKIKMGEGVARFKE